MSWPDGRRPAPDDVESVWEIAPHRFVYVEHRPAHAGHGLITVFAGDFDERVAGAAARGLQPAQRETYENGVRKAIYTDPDGNEFSFGGPPPLIRATSTAITRPRTSTPHCGRLPP